VSDLIERLKHYADPQYKELLGRGSLDNVITDILEDAVEAAARIEALEAALREIAASSKRKGPPDFQYWWDVANDRREIARAALAPEPEK
jgi:hypothetical protein